MVDYLESVALESQSEDPDPYFFEFLGNYLDGYLNDYLKMQKKIYENKAQGN